MLIGGGDGLVMDMIPPACEWFFGGEQTYGAVVFRLSGLRALFSGIGRVPSWDDAYNWGVYVYRMCWETCLDKSVETHNEGSVYFETLTMAMDLTVSCE